MQQQKNPLISQTPVLAGHMIMGVPDTPILNQDEKDLNIKTPLLDSINVLMPSQIGNGADGNSNQVS